MGYIEYCKGFVSKTMGNPRDCHWVLRFALEFLYQGHWIIKGNWIHHPANFPEIDDINNQKRGSYYLLTYISMSIDFPKSMWGMGVGVLFWLLGTMIFQRFFFKGGLTNSELVGKSTGTQRI